MREEVFMKCTLGEPYFVIEYQCLVFGPIRRIKSLRYYYSLQEEWNGSD